MHEQPDEFSHDVYSSHRLVRHSTEGVVGVVALSLHVRDIPLLLEDCGASSLEAFTEKEARELCESINDELEDPDTSGVETVEMVRVIRQDDSTMVASNAELYDRCNPRYNVVWFMLYAYTAHDVAERERTRESGILPLPLGTPIYEVVLRPPSYA